MTTEKAPVAGAPAAGRRRAEAALLSQAFRDIGSEDALANLLATGRPDSVADLASLAALQAGMGRRAPEAEAGGSGRDVGSGAAAAAGVLTAIDEDNEGDEEAPVPADFDYFTDAEDEEEL